jgi:hypothetical protein
MQIYSIEAGKVYTESYNINHILNSSSGCYNPFAQDKDSITLNQHCSHLHILKLNSQYPNNENGVNFSFNILPTSFSFQQQSNHHLSQVVHLTNFFIRLKILPLSCSNSLDSVVLLI